MYRWISFLICVAIGLVFLIVGWLMPVHLRAIEPSVLKRAGRNTPGLEVRGFELLHNGQSGAAEMLSRAADHDKLAFAPELAAAAAANAKQYPTLHAWGTDADPNLNLYFPAAPTEAESNFTDFVVREDNRTSALKILQSSPQPAARELLRSRSLTSTKTFPPSQSPGGEAFDTAVAITALLLEQGKLTAGLSNDLYSAALEANNSGHTEKLEQILLDTMSLGQRFNWGQLVSFVGNTDSADTLHDQADLVRSSGASVPSLFAAMELSGDPKAITQYLRQYPATGLKDLASAYPLGGGAVRELARSGQRLYTSQLRQMASEYNPFARVISFSADYCWRTPLVASIIKWLLYLGGGFLLALAVHFARPAVSELEEPLQVRGFHFAREILFALGLLLAVLLVSEPFLAPDNAAPARPFRLRVPTVGRAVQPGNPATTLPFMDDKSKIIPMALFFILQGMLYIASVVKLAEIRRQRVAPRMKLKLLENEEHLFDAGLYLGFLGTIVAFIIYSMYVHVQFDLMVAYSSTSFGILFVSFFKIFHLRPVRRRLLLEAEAESEAATTPPIAQALSVS